MANWWLIQPLFRQFVSIAPSGVVAAPVWPPIALVGAPAIVAIIPAVAAAAVAAIAPAPIAIVIVAMVPAVPPDIHVLLALSVAAGLDNRRRYLTGQPAAQKGRVSAGGKRSREKQEGEKHRQFQSVTYCLRTLSDTQSSGYVI